jgi:hypothetical protein
MEGGDEERIVISMLLKVTMQLGAGKELKSRSWMKKWKQPR